MRIKTEKTLESLELHLAWKLSEKSLAWWQNETGYVGVDIHMFCRIPTSRSNISILIGCLYLLHLDYIIQHSRRPAIFLHKYKAEVFEFLKADCINRNIPTSDDGLFPWSHLNPPHSV